jgi:hypothetical protein
MPSISAIHQHTPSKSALLVSLKIAAALAPIFLMVVLVNYFRDPGELFYRRQGRSPIVELVLQGNHVQQARAPENWGVLQIGFIRGFAARRRAPSVALWGTSRSAEISQADFPGTSFFNHCIPGGSVLDYTALYSLYKEQGQIPRTVIIGIDPWTFCARSPCQIRNRMYFLPNPKLPLHPRPELEPYYIEGARRLGVTIPAFRWQSFKEKLSRMANVFSLTYFQSAVKLNRRAQPQPTPHEAVHGKFVLRRDGSYSLCPDPARIDRVEVADIAKEFARLTGGCCLDSSVMVKEHVQLFDRLLAALAGDGARVALYLPPMHPRAYDLLTASQPNHVESELRKLGAKRGVTVLGSFNPHQYQLDGVKPWFIDQYHPSRMAVDLIFRAHANDIQAICSPTPTR